MTSENPFAARGKGEKKEIPPACALYSLVVKNHARGKKGKGENNLGRF